MQKGTWVIIGVLIVVLLLGGGYFLMNKNTNSSNPTPVATTDSKTSQNTENGILEIVVEGEEFSFSPSSFTVKSGQRVKVIFKNIGEMKHDLVVEELGVRTKIIDGGEDDILEFVAPTPGGKLTFYCSVESHRPMGMEGTITVE